MLWKWSDYSATPLSFDSALLGSNTRVPPPTARAAYSVVATLEIWLFVSRFLPAFDKQSLSFAICTKRVFTLWREKWGKKQTWTIWGGIQENASWGDNWASSLKYDFILTRNINWAQNVTLRLWCSIPPQSSWLIPSTNKHHVQRPRTERWKKLTGISWAVTVKLLPLFYSGKNPHFYTKSMAAREAVPLFGTSALQNF